MLQTNEVILNSELSPISKVYNIARNLYKEKRISVLLWYAILELKDKHYNEIEYLPELPLSLSDDDIKKLWDDLEDIPMSPLTEKLDRPYFIFPVGTSKEKIWAWFDKNYSKGVNALIYD